MLETFNPRDIQSNLEHVLQLHPTQLGGRGGGARFLFVWPDTNKYQPRIPILISLKEKYYHYINKI